MKKLRIVCLRGILINRNIIKSKLIFLLGENVQLSKESCGRTLDMDLVGDTLYAIDTYRGFIEYNLIENTKITYNLKDKIPGYETNDKVFSSIRQDPLNSNIVYISFSSTKYNLDKIYFVFLEQEASGILIAFNKLTKKVTLIGKDFVLANGLEITEDTKSLLLNDLCNQRILKYDLTELNAFLKAGGKSPEFKVFRDKIPGYPDNLTKFKNYLIAALVFDLKENDFLDNHILANVYLRRLTHRLMYLGSESLKFLSKYYSCNCLDKLQNSFESGKILMKLPYKSSVAIFDQHTSELVYLIRLPIGYITHAIYNPTTKRLYFGSIAHKEIYSMKFDLI